MGGIYGDSKHGSERLARYEYTVSQLPKAGTARWRASGLVYGCDRSAAEDDPVRKWYFLIRRIQRNRLKSYELFFA
jgi:hypothetical protein